MATPPFDPDQTKPASADLISTYPAAEQAFRDIIESWLLFEHNTGGTHKQTTLDDLTAAVPAGTAGKVTLWNDAGALNARDGTGTVEALILGQALTAEIADTAVTLAKLADIITASFLGRTTAATGVPEVLTVTQATAMLNVATSTLKGLVPATGGGTANFLRADLTFAAVPDSFGSQLFHVRDEKTSGTAAGTFTSGAWQTRTLNTSKTNEISGASFATDQITLPAGTYWIDAGAVGKRVQGHKTRLQNITDTTTTLVGTNVNSNTDDTSTNANIAPVSGRFTIAGTKVFELQHRCAITRATDGFGEALGFGVVEVYADVKIWKVG